MPKKDPGVRILIVNSEGGSSHRKSEVLRQALDVGVGRGIKILVLYSAIYYCDPLSQLGNLRYVVEWWFPYNDGGYSLQWRWVWFPAKTACCVQLKEIDKVCAVCGYGLRTCAFIGEYWTTYWNITAPWYNVDQAMPSEYHLHDPCEKVAWAFWTI